MVNGDRKEGICRLNVDGNGCDYLRILSDLETKLRNNTNPKEKIELALQGALMFYGADRAYVIEVDDELGIGVNTYECCARSRCCRGKSPTAMRRSKPMKGRSLHTACESQN